MPICTRITSLLWLLTTLACRSSPNRDSGTRDTSSVPSEGEKAVREAIDRASAAYTDALLRGDPVAMAGNYAPEAVTMFQGESTWRGRPEVEANFRRMLGDMTVTSAVFHTEDLTLAAELAVETGSGSVTLTRRGAALPETLQLKYLTVWRRQPDGSLKIAYDISNSDAQPRK